MVHCVYWMVKGYIFKTNQKMHFFLWKSNFSHLGLHCFPNFYPFMVFWSWKGNDYLFEKEKLIKCYPLANTPIQKWTHLHLKYSKNSGTHWVGIFKSQQLFFVNLQFLFRQSHWLVYSLEASIETLPMSTLIIFGLVLRGLTTLYENVSHWEKIK